MLPHSFSFLQQLFAELLRLIYLLIFQTNDTTTQEKKKPTFLMTSFFTQIMEPGGGLMLIPFVRTIIGILLALTISGFLAGVARIHMVVLSFLSGGLLFSISMFEREYKKAQRNRGGGGSAAAATSGKPEKTD